MPMNMPDIPTPRDFSNHRNGDDRYVNVHATGGEVFVPPEVINANPAIWDIIAKTALALGGNPDTLVVGSPEGNYNPVDGDQEFFFGSIGNSIAGSLAGAAFGPIAGGLTSGVLTYLDTDDIVQAATSGFGQYIGSSAGGKIDSFGLDGSFGFTSNGTGFLSDAINSIGNASFGQLLGGAAGSYLGSELFAGSSDSGSQPNIATPQVNVPDVTGGNNQNPVATPNSTPDNSDAGYTSDDGYNNALPAGVSYYNPITNRDSGEVRYNLGNLLSDNNRRQGWGSLIPV